MDSSEVQVSFPGINVDKETYLFIDKELFEQVIVTKKHVVFRRKTEKDNGNKV